MVAASCSGFSATRSCAVEQFGLAMMFFRVNPEMESGFTSGTISGTSGSVRKADELSMTTQPCLAIFGDHSLETLPPADIRQMSVSEKSYWSSTLVFSVLSPKATSEPSERREASGTISLTGKPRSSRMLSISRPTLPVAPTTATLKPISKNLLSLSALLLGEPAGRSGSPPPWRTRGEGEQAKGDQTVVAVVFLAVVLVEDRRAAAPPAGRWPGKSNAKSAIKRPRMEGCPVWSRLLRGLAEESISTSARRIGPARTCDRHHASTGY